MQQQERDLIAGLFGRLQQFENQPRDAEAERLIADYVSRQPAAVYLLTQTAIVQEEALKQAKARIAELESKASETSFLSSAPKIGPWGAAPSAPQLRCNGLPGKLRRLLAGGALSLQAAPIPSRRLPAGADGGGRRRWRLPAHGADDGGRRGRRRLALPGHQQHVRPQHRPGARQSGAQSVVPAAARPDAASRLRTGCGAMPATQCGVDSYNSTPDNSGFDNSGPTIPASTARATTTTTSSQTNKGEKIGDDRTSYLGNAERPQDLDHAGGMRLAV